MSPPFGFSIGDFIAVGDLARRIFKALDESRGSTADYKSLREALLSLARSLDDTSEIFLCLSSGTNTDAGCSPSVGPLNGVCYQLGCCKRLMEDFLVSSRAYTETLLNGQGSQFRKEWKKIQWCLFETDDVQKLQERLKIHIDAFNIYASAIMKQGVARTEQKAVEISESTARIEENMTEISESIARIEENITEISESIARIEENMTESIARIEENITEISKSIARIEENITEISKSIARIEENMTELLEKITMKTLQNDNGKSYNLLNIKFKGLPSQEKTSQREYEITDAPEGAFIAWIAMAVVIKTIFISAIGLGPTAHRCPRCSGSNAGAIAEKVPLKCCHCQLIFRTTEEEMIVKLPDDPPEQASAIGINQTAVSENESGEEYAFGRIHHPREMLKYQATKRHEKENLYTDTTPPSRFRRGWESGGGEVEDYMHALCCSNYGFGPHNPRLGIGCANCGCTLPSKEAYGGMYHPNRHNVENLNFEV